MRKFILGAGLSILLLAFGGCDDYSDEAATQASDNAGLATEGAQLYEAYDCVVCHGNDGRISALGVSRIIADIDDVRDVQNALYALKFPAPERHEAMVSVASGLDDEDIAKLSAFVATLE